MKVIKHRVHCVNIDFKSANDILHIHLTTDDGPELRLEDGSWLLFTDTKTYYKVAPSDDINIDALKENYLVDFDDVAGVTYEKEDIIEVEDYICDNCHFYRFNI